MTIVGGGGGQGEDDETVCHHCVMRRVRKEWENWKQVGRFGDWKTKRKTDLFVVLLRCMRVDEGEGTIIQERQCSLDDNFQIVEIGDSDDLGDGDARIGNIGKIGTGNERENLKANGSV